MYSAYEYRCKFSLNECSRKNINKRVIIHVKTDSHYSYKCDEGLLLFFYVSIIFICLTIQIYQKISRKTAVMRIALDDNKMCKDLGENQNNYEHMTFSLKSNWTDQPVVLFLNMRGHTLISNTVSVEKYAAHLPTVKMPKAKKSTPKLRLGEINKKMNIDETLDNIIRVRKVLEFSHIENNDKLIKSRSQDSSVHHVLTRSRRDTKGYRLVNVVNLLFLTVIYVAYWFIIKLV